MNGKGVQRRKSEDSTRADEKKGWDRERKPQRWTNGEGLHHLIYIVMTLVKDERSEKCTNIVYNAISIMGTRLGKEESRGQVLPTSQKVRYRIKAH